MSVPSVLLLFVAVAGGASVRPAPPQPPPGIACSASSNVTCPANSFGCVPSHYELKFACNMSSGAPGHPFTTCSPGAPHPLSTTKANVLIIGDSVSNGSVLPGRWRGAGLLAACSLQAITAVHCLGPPPLHRQRVQCVVIASETTAPVRATDCAW